MAAREIHIKRRLVLACPPVSGPPRALRGALRPALSLILLPALLPPAVAAGEPGWPMRGYDPANSRLVPHVGIRDATHAWRADVFAGAAPPAVARDGTIYAAFNFQDAGRHWGELWAFAPDGTPLWNVRLLNAVGDRLNCRAPPVLDQAGNIHLGWCIYVKGGSIESVAFLSFTPDGRLRWRFEPGIDRETVGSRTQAIIRDGVIYAPLATRMTAGGNERGSIFALNAADGSVRWRFVSPNRDGFSPGLAMGPNGKLYVASNLFFDTPHLYCIDSATGRADWIIDMPQAVSGYPPAIDAQGNLYIVDFPRANDCGKFSPQGDLLWSYNVPVADPKYSPLIVGEHVYISFNSGFPDRQGLHASTVTRAN